MLASKRARACVYVYMYVKAGLDKHTFYTMHVLDKIVNVLKSSGDIYLAPPRTFWDYLQGECDRFQGKHIRTRNLVLLRFPPEETSCGTSGQAGAGSGFGTCCHVGTSRRSG